MNQKTNMLESEDKYTDPETTMTIHEHKQKMFELFDELFSWDGHDSEEKNLVTMMNSLNDYAKLLFSVEEKILKADKYPDYEAHMKEHRRFTRAAIELRRKASDDSENVSREDMEKLKEVFVDHIENKDRLYVPFLRIQAYIKDQKK